MSQQPKNSEKFFWKRILPDGDHSSFENQDDSEAVITEYTSDERQISSTILRTASESKLFPDSRLIIGIPAQNSEGSIAKSIIALRPLEGADIVVCDDFSTDATEQIARELGCKLIKHPRQLGMSDSLTSLFLASRRLHATNLLTVDPEMDFISRDALNLLEKVQSGECDIAIGTDKPLDYEAPKEETIDGVRDPFSVFRAYGRRALALITPAGTTSVVPESDILHFAQQQGLKVREYRVSSAGSREMSESSKSRKAAVKSIPLGIESSLSKFATLAVLKHPLLFFGAPSVGLIAAAVVQAVETLQSWGISGVKADYGFYFAGYDLVLSLILGVGALILESQRRNSSFKDRGRNNSTRTRE